MSDSIRKAHRKVRKFGSKVVIIDELSEVIPSSKEKTEHIKKLHKDYIVKPDHNS